MNSGTCLAIISCSTVHNHKGTIATGEVPNLFESDEYEKVINAVRPTAKEYGIAEGNRDQIFNFFISRVRGKLHVVLCMSPIGDAFRCEVVETSCSAVIPQHCTLNFSYPFCRRRCRMFPSLVNCCTIDWFLPWPTEALLSVAEESFMKTLPDPEVGQKLALICVTMHEVYRIR